MSPFQTNGHRTFVVKLPTTRRFFRLKEVELYIARQLDGSTPPAAIKERVAREFGASVTLETLERFIAKLGQLQLLEPPEGTPRAAPVREPLVRGNLLHLRFRAFDPDRLLGRLARVLGFCFTRWFLALSAAVIFVAAAIAVTNRDDMVRQLVPLLRLDVVLVAWFSLILITVLHEFAHGIACKRFGGEVRELGFLLIYFHPALYCNISDAWLFPERWKRLSVTFAGAYFEGIVWAVATVVWRVVEPGSGLASIALIIVTTSAIKTFFNLNPLIKLDGYYLLSDLVGIPNLRERSFRYLGRILRLGRGSPPPGLETITARERWIYVSYGLLAGAYSVSLLWLIAAYVGSALVERYQAAGFILFSALLLLVLRWPLRRAVVKTALFFRPRAGLRPLVRWCIKLLVVLGLLGGAGAALVLWHVELRVAGTFEVLPTRQRDVRAEAEGILAEILADEGERVEKGMVIARLSARDHAAELAKTEAEIEAKRAALKMLKAGPRREEVDLSKRRVATARTRWSQAARWLKEARKLKDERLAKARTSMEKAAARLQFSRAAFARLQGLFRENLISEKELQEAEELASLRENEVEEAEAEINVVLADEQAEARKEVAVAKDELDEAQAALDVLLAGHRPEAIESMQAEIARLEAHRTYIQENLKLMVLVSPAAGIITTAKLKENVGQHVKKGDLVAEIQEIGTTRVDIAISEKDAGDIRIGQPIALKARSHPDTVFHAEVTAIAPRAAPEDQPGHGPIVRVSTALDDPLALLKPGMTGMAKVSCGERPLHEVITRRIYRYLRVEFWSWW